MPSTAQLHTFSGMLTPRAPFDFTKTLAFMQRFSPMAGEQAIRDGTLTKAMALHGRAVAFVLHDVGSIERPVLSYTLHAERALRAAEREMVLDRVRGFLSLDDDLERFYAIAHEDSQFAPVMERFYGLHQPRFLSPFEIACWAVLTQRTPMPIARRIKDQLIERFGASITLDGVLYRAFPEAAHLATADAEELVDLVRNARKAEYLTAVIQFFGEVDERWLREGPYEEVAARILGIRGIGEWSSSSILIRGLGRMERVPAPERALSQAAAHLYNGGKPLEAEVLRRMLDRYGTEQGYWAFYTRIAVNDGAHRPVRGPN